MGNTLRTSNVNILEMHLCLGSKQVTKQKCRQICSTNKFAERTVSVPFVVEICMGGTLRTLNFRILCT
jgi:hypothetical protein